MCYSHRFFPVLRKTVSKFNVLSWIVDEKSPISRVKRLICGHGIISRNYSSCCALSVCSWNTLYINSYKNSYKRTKVGRCLFSRLNESQSHFNEETTRVESVVGRWRNTKCEKSEANDEVIIVKPGSTNREKFRIISLLPFIRRFLNSPWSTYLPSQCMRCIGRNISKKLRARVHSMHKNHSPIATHDSCSAQPENL